MPSLIQNHRKQEAITRLKRAYTIINQAKNLSTIDNGEYYLWDNTLSAEQYLKKYWIPYFKGAKICMDYDDCGYNSHQPWKVPTGNYSEFSYTFRIPFITEDGILYSVSLGNTVNSDIGKKLILIDINGPQRPNESGKDFFFFLRTDEGKIMPYGYDKSSEEIDTDCISGSKEFCAAKIIKDSWTIKKDYPW